jgi:hypothetical protein
MNLAKEKIEPVRWGAIVGSVLTVTIDWMNWMEEVSFYAPGFCQSHPPRVLRCDCLDPQQCCISEEESFASQVEF